MQVEKKPVPPPPPEEFVITISRTEAEDIFNILGCLGGDVPERKTSSKLWSRLARLLDGNSTTLKTVILSRKRDDE